MGWPRRPPRRVRRATRGRGGRGTPRSPSLPPMPVLDLEALAGADLSWAAAHDVVVGADITYEPALAAAVVRAYEALLVRPDQDGLLAATRRGDAPWAALQAALAATPLAVADVSAAVRAAAADAWAQPPRGEGGSLQPCGCALSA
ncbi:hypothetical protein I4F81_007678 [Pyropia yezoensis]|uniref:Uncharacterized protein n=1 Tax=Pyropia yezoensis TaxID=2788 RepID=A0ACC3C5R8_PYRYE|nr:hypothetical protein I4F81_007678 [Neopyropia yezoensis]